MKTVTIDLKRGATLTQLKRFRAEKGEHIVKAIFKDITTFNGRKYYIENVSKDGTKAHLVDAKSGAIKMGILKKFKIVRIT